MKPGATPDRARQCGAGRYRQDPKGRICRRGLTRCLTSQPPAFNGTCRDPGRAPRRFTVPCDRG